MKTKRAGSDPDSIRPLFYQEGLKSLKLKTDSNTQSLLTNQSGVDNSFYHLKKDLNILKLTPLKATNGPTTFNFAQLLDEPNPYLLPQTTKSVLKPNLTSNYSNKVKNEKKVKNSFLDKDPSLLWSSSNILNPSSKFSISKAKLHTQLEKIQESLAAYKGEEGDKIHKSHSTPVPNATFYSGKYKLPELQTPNKIFQHAQNKEKYKNMNISLANIQNPMVM